jgi:hypothetical protein
VKRYLTILSSVEELPPDAAAAALLAAFDVADQNEARVLAAACAVTLERLAPPRGFAPGISGASGVGAARRVLAPLAFLRLFARTSHPDPKFHPAAAPRAQLRRALLRAIAAIWSSLPEQSRREIAAVTADGWADALATIPPPAADSARRNILALAAEVRQPSLAGALAALLSDPRAPLALDAERLLMDLAQRAADPAASQLSPAQAAAIRAAITKALSDCETHGLRGVFIATHALLTPDTIARARRRAAAIRDGTPNTAPTDPLATWFVDRPALELGASIRASVTPLSRRRAWEWLTIKDLAPACSARLRAAANSAEHDAVLSRWHLSLRPARSRAAREVLRSREGSAWLPNGREAPALDTNARAGAARLAKLTRTPSPSPAAAPPRALDWTLIDPDARVRLVASVNAGGSEVADYAFDHDADVARSAAIAWSDAALRVGGRCIVPRNPDAAAARLDITLAMCASPHAAVRAIGKQDAQSADLFDGRSAPSRINAWRALEHDRAAFIDTIRAASSRAEASQDADARQALLALIRRLDLAADFTDILNTWVARATTAAAQTDTARAGATAITLLSSLTPSQLGDARASLDSCLHAPDTRVRANAVETIMLRVRRGLEPAPADILNSMLELKDDDAHRVRANTIRGLLSACRDTAANSAPRAMAQSQHLTAPPHAEPKHALAATSRDSLERMLRDERPLHRVAAVWAVSRERWLPRADPTLRTRLASLARDDHESSVRRRAADIQRLLGDHTVSVTPHDLTLSGTAA